jgi:hypothetical protein
MKFKLLLLVAGFIPALVMAQAKPANQLAVEKPIAVNPTVIPSATPKQTQAGEFPALYPSPTPHVISVGGTTATEFQQKTDTPSSIEKPIEVNPSERMYHPKIQEKRNEIWEEIKIKVGNEIMIKLQTSCYPTFCTPAEMKEEVEYILQQLKNQVAVNPSERIVHPKIQNKREEIRGEIMIKLENACYPPHCTPAEMVEIVEYMVQQLKNQVAVKAN